MATRKTPKAPAKATLPAHVLVVEDDAVIGLSIEQALEEAGVARVEICTSTEQALAALRAGTPDVIVLDVHLADRDDGWAIAELVSTLGPDAPQIVFSTGQPGDIPPEIAAMGSVLAKPYDPAMLVDTLSKPARRGLMARLRGQ